jgi:hypothetical protein
MSKEITDKILSTFESLEDMKEYASSQYLTIITQSKKITELERKTEVLETKLADAEKRAAVSSSLSIEQPEGQSDTETVCVIQIAMLKGLAMNKELTLEETKKLEVFAKTLQMIRGKPTSDSDKKRDVGTKLTTEQLLALASSLTEQ